jgi:hypothetical protein
MIAITTLRSLPLWNVSLLGRHDHQPVVLIGCTPVVDRVFDSKIALMIRIIRGSAIVQFSKALLGLKPQQTMDSTAESNNA